MMGKMLVNSYLSPVNLIGSFNTDESEVTIDSRSKLVNNSQLSCYSYALSVSQDSRSSGTGAEPTNKSGYSATIIGGSTISGGWPVPSKF